MEINYRWKLANAYFPKNKGKKVVLLSCHYDIIEWLQPDWVYDVNTKVLKKKRHREATRN